MKNMHGRSLVEVMIAMAIGLVISLAVSSLYITNSQTYRVFDDKSLLEEDGRMALNTLAFHVRMAGYGVLLNTTGFVDSGGGKTSFDKFNLADEAIWGCSGGFVTPSGASPIACTGGATPDAFRIRYVVDGDNANQVAASGVNTPTDCLGQPVASSGTTYMVENRFYIAVNPATGKNELYCAGNGGIAFGTPVLQPGKPLLENVVDMRLTYGYDQQGTQSANSFYVAASLTDGSAPAPTGGTPPADASQPPPTPWSRVVSAKICLVMRSANDGLTPTPMKYTNCSGTVVTAADKRLYSTFSTVVSLRGRTNGATL